MLDITLIQVNIERRRAQQVGVDLQILDPGFHPESTDRRDVLGHLQPGGALTVAEKTELGEALRSVADRSRQCVVSGGEEHRAPTAVDSLLDRGHDRRVVVRHPVPCRTMRLHIDCGHAANSIVRQLNFRQAAANFSHRQPTRSQRHEGSARDATNLRCGHEASMHRRPAVRGANCV